MLVFCLLPSAYCLLGLEDVDRLARLEGDDRLLPAGHLAPAAAPAPLLARHVQRVDRLDPHIEGLLHRLADLDLVRLAMDLEGVLTLLHQVGALLGDQRPDQHVAVALDRHYAALRAARSRSSLSSPQVRSM